jgi:hypothetical protein
LFGCHSAKPAPSGSATTAMVAKSPTLNGSFITAPPSFLTLPAISAALWTCRYGNQLALAAPSGEAK